MILVDTNVVSETTKPSPDRNVIAWLDAQLVETLYISAVSMAELLLGIALMPDGARKMHLDGVLRDQQAALFGPRIVAFAEREAQAYATIVSRAKRDGKAISIVDGQIAATALAGGFCIASRDRRPFEAAGLRVINPWTVPAPP